MTSKLLLFILPCLFSFTEGVFHQDTPLKVKKDGEIVGLPDQFSNPVFKLNEGLLKIGNKEVDFPSCIRSYFNTHEEPVVQLSASWYHSKDILPYYIHFRISQEGKDYSYSILVDLETLELISISIGISDVTWHRSHRLVIEDYCAEAYEGAIKSRK